MLFDKGNVCPLSGKLSVCLLYGTCPCQPSMCAQGSAEDVQPPADATDVCATALGQAHDVRGVCARGDASQGAASEELLPERGRGAARWRASWHLGTLACESHSIALHCPSGAVTLMCDILFLLFLWHLMLQSSWCVNGCSEYCHSHCSFLCSLVISLRFLTGNPLARF
jgi:hypothetical protein